MTKEDKFTISFEFFPPKTENSKQTFLQEAIQLAKLKPQFFSVTYGAGGSTRDGTIQIVKVLQQHTPITVAPHLSCMGSTCKDLIDVLKIYQSLGIDRIVALRGDLPSGMGQTGELKFASELVALIREITHEDFHIEVAAYPEYHPQAVSVQDDILNLKRKVDAGADSAITQYFYNSDAYFYFLEECVKAHIAIPIVPGIMPITSCEKLARFSDVCGAEIPRWIRKRLESYRDDVESVKAFGLEVVYQLCERLMMGGASGLHFYTLNHAEPTCTLVDMLYPVSRMAIPMLYP